MAEEEVIKQCEGPDDGLSLRNINKCYPWHALVAVAGWAAVTAIVVWKRVHG